VTTVNAATPPPGVEAALRRASRATGVDFDYLVTTARRESAFKPHARSSTSSATGLFQFIEETWLATVKRIGGALGLGRQAASIERTADGRHRIADPARRQAILALREDPQVAALVAAAHTRQTAAHLERSLGRKPDAGELYLAHFLGPSGAVRLIRAVEATPHASAADLFPRAAAANRAIFHDASGAPRSVAAVYRVLTADYDDRVRVAAGGARDVPADGDVVIAPAAAPSPMHLASHFTNVRPHAWPVAAPAAHPLFAWHAVAPGHGEGTVERRAAPAPPAAVPAPAAASGGSGRHPAIAGRGDGSIVALWGERHGPRPLGLLERRSGLAVVDLHARDIHARL